MRRIFYLNKVGPTKIPLRRDFRLSRVFNDAALQAIIIGLLEEEQMIDFEIAEKKEKKKKSGKE